VREPLRLYEVADPLPRVSWVAELDRPSAGGPSPDGAADVSLAYERLDAHTLRLRASTPPGFIVVRDRFHPGWRARDEGGEVALVPLGAESWALRTPGGSRTFTARFAPAWRAPALALAGLGLVLTVVLAARPRAGEAQPAGAAAARSA
jgi:hypothetical protein